MLQIDNVKIPGAEVTFFVAPDEGRLDIEGTLASSKAEEKIEMLKNKEGARVEVNGEDDIGYDISGEYEFKSCCFEEESDSIKYSANLWRTQFFL